MINQPENESKQNKLQDIYQEYQIQENEETEIGQGFLQALLEIIIYIVVILTSVIIIRYFIIAPFSVDGSSMEPNLHDGELIIINKIGYSDILDYKVGEPERGDIVVIIPPNDTSKFYVKRIIGLPNEKVEFTNGQVIIRNNDYPQGIQLKEEYLSANNSYTNPPGGYRNKIVTLGDRDYYVLGDNRSHSHDSRSFGAVNKSNIVGKVWFVGYPFDKFRTISHFNYNLLINPIFLK
jgi:signal peptidase I